MNFPEIKDDLKELAIFCLVLGVVTLGFLLKREVRNLKHMQRVLDATVERSGEKWLAAPLTEGERRLLENK